MRSDNLIWLLNARPSQISESFRLPRNDGDVGLRLVMGRTDSSRKWTGRAAADTLARYCGTSQQGVSDPSTAKQESNTPRFQLNDPADPPQTPPVIV